MAEVEDLGADISSCIEAQSVKDKTAPTETPPSVSQASGLTSAEKRIRALKKKLQQIEALKEKQEHGQVLEKTQVCCHVKEKRNFFFVFSNKFRICHVFPMSCF